MTHPGDHRLLKPCPLLSLDETLPIGNLPRKGERVQGTQGAVYLPEGSRIGQELYSLLGRKSIMKPALRAQPVALEKFGPGEGGIAGEATFYLGQGLLPLAPAMAGKGAKYIS
jgi:hypothetical protein